MIPKEIKYNLHYDDVRGDFTAIYSAMCLQTYKQCYGKKNQSICLFI